MNQAKRQVSQQLVERLKDIAASIGNTPLLPIKKAFQKKNIQLFAKLEWQQLGDSVKARAAFNICLLYTSDAADDW